MRTRLLVLGVIVLVCAAFAGATSPSVSIQTFGGPKVAGPQGITLGPDGAIWFTNEKGASIGRITSDGTIDRKSVV